MIFLSQCLTIGSFILFGSFSTFCAHTYNEQKTEELKQYLSGLVRILNNTDNKPDPIKMSQRVTELVQLGADPNTHNNIDGSSAIHLAAEAGDIDLVKFICSYGVNIDARTMQKRTPLMFAAIYSHLKAIALIITLNANIEAKDYKDYTPLTYAVRYGHQQAVTLLISLGANIETLDHNSWTSLTLAANLDKEIAIELLGLGAAMEKKAFFFFAAYNIKVKFSGFFSNESILPGEEELHRLTRLAAKDELKKRFAKIPLDQLNDTVNKHTAHGFTPLDIALARADKPAFLLLLEHGADPTKGRFNPRVFEWEQSLMAKGSRKPSLYYLNYDYSFNHYLAILSPLSKDVPMEIIKDIINFMLLE